MRIRNASAPLCASALALVLAACGGGGSGGFPFPAPTPPPPAPSSNADLADLKINQGEILPAFSPSQEEYFLGTAFFDTEMVVTATTADPGATIVASAAGGTGFPIALTSGVPSAPVPLGSPVFGLSVQVTAADGVTTKTYVIITDIGAPPGLETYAKASNNGAGDGFGAAVAASGDTVVVGAPSEDSSAIGVDGDSTNNGAPESGAAYVFVRTGDSWTQQAYLKASNTGAGDRFGEHVAISGDTIVVGAASEDSSAVGVDGDATNDLSADSGAVYVFVRTGTTWAQQAYLKASNTGAADAFGSAVSISGDTLVVGAPGEDSSSAGVNGDPLNNGAAGSGAAYVFVRSGSTWSQQAYLKASNTEALDGFGSAVACALDRVAVGAPLEDSDATGVNGNQGNNAAPDSGAVYVFLRVAGVWSEEAYVKASNTDPSDHFGGAVGLTSSRIPIVSLGDTFDLDSSTLVVGAANEASSATGVGGDESNNAAAGSGAAYVFTSLSVFGVLTSDWEQDEYLKASNTEGGDQFGSSVSVVRGVIVVGAPGEDSDAGGIGGPQGNNNALGSGAAYVFLDDGGWAQDAYVKASNARAGDAFGTSVSLSFGTLVVGSPSEDSNAIGINGNQAGTGSNESGAAYVIR